MMLAILASVFLGQLVYLKTQNTPRPVNAQVPPVSSCDPVACAQIGGECAKNRAECDKNGMIPITCDVTKDPATGERKCQLLGGQNANDAVCCKNIWGWRELGRDSCNAFKSASECDLATQVGIHSCCWNPQGTAPDQCVSGARGLCTPVSTTINAPPQNKIITVPRTNDSIKKVNPNSTIRNRQGLPQ